MGGVCDWTHNFAVPAGLWGPMLSAGGTALTGVIRRIQGGNHARTLSSCRKGDYSDKWIAAAKLPQIFRLEDEINALVFNFMVLRSRRPFTKFGPAQIFRPAASVAGLSAG